MTKTRISALLVMLVTALPLLIFKPAFSFTDQTTTERILRENKRFIEFINVCLTNFSENKKEDFRKVFELHFNADVAYLQSDYRKAYKRIYASQGEMEKLYQDMVKNRYLEDSKTLLDKLAPGIIRSKNTRARLYLTLGYRDRTVGWTYYTVGDASNPKYYSYKLYKYEDAIKMSRRAKRFGFLALFESQNMEIKKKIYNQLCKIERSANNPFLNRFVDLKEDDYIKEMNKNLGDESDDIKKEPEARKDAEVKKEGAKEPGRAPVEGAEEKTFEKRVEKNVRYRNETKAARHLINGEFDKAEDIMRKYIDDFNFKLIEATLDVLSASGGDASSPEKVDYSKFKIHLVDNYSRLSKKSLLLDFVDSLRVEDVIAEKNRAVREAGETSDKGVKSDVPDKSGGKEMKENGKGPKEEKKDDGKEHR